MNINTLNPCPCCGRSPTLDWEEIGWRVYCPDCPDPESRNGVARPEEDAAVKEWNTVVYPSVLNRMLVNYRKDTNES